RGRPILQRPRVAEITPDVEERETRVLAEILGRGHLERRRDDPVEELATTRRRRERGVGEICRQLAAVVDQVENRDALAFEEPRGLHPPKEVAHRRLRELSRADRELSCA